MVLGMLLHWMDHVEASSAVGIPVWYIRHHPRNHPQLPGQPVPGANPLNQKAYQRITYGPQIQNHWNGF